VASKPKFWPWSRPQTFGLGLASISLSYYAIGHFSGKNRVKFGNFVNFSGNNLKSYVVNHYLVLFFIIIIWRQPLSQTPEIGLSLVLGLEVLASCNITACTWTLQCWETVEGHRRTTLSDVDRLR